LIPASGRGALEDSIPVAPRREPYETIKRLVDVAIALVVLIVLSPVWLLLALLVKATSPGPAFFRNTMVGRGGRLFSYHKFRTMVAGDDSHHREWLKEFVTKDAPYKDGRFKVDADPRRTGIGKFLRRTSLDEIPQLIDVLKGDMSVVGPRPPLLYEFEQYDNRACGRLAVRPGITGLYQVTARSAVPFSQMLAIDLDYIARRSLWLDLKIIVATPWVMLTGNGAG
jgi:lipopolysaccharide/colanic/teichoic acid biosynthesis glycosyltransferase